MEAQTFITVEETSSELKNLTLTEIIQKNELHQVIQFPAVNVKTFYEYIQTISELGNLEMLKYFIDIRKKRGNGTMPIPSTFWDFVAIQWKFNKEISIESEYIIQSLRYLSENVSSDGIRYRHLFKKAVQFSSGKHRKDVLEWLILDGSVKISFYQEILLNCISCAEDLEIIDEFCVNPIITYDIQFKWFQVALLQQKDFQMFQAIMEFIGEENLGNDYIQTKWLQEYKGETALNTRVRLNPNAYIHNPEELSSLGILYYYKYPKHEEPFTFETSATFLYNEIIVKDDVENFKKCLDIWKKDQPFKDFLYYKCLYLYHCPLINEICSELVNVHSYSLLQTIITTFNYSSCMIGSSNDSRLSSISSIPSGWRILPMLNPETPDTFNPILLSYTFQPDVNETFRPQDIDKVRFLVLSYLAQMNRDVSNYEQAMMPGILQQFREINSIPFLRLIYSWIIVCGNLETFIEWSRSYQEVFTSYDMWEIFLYSLYWKKIEIAEFIWQAYFTEMKPNSEEELSYLLQQMKTHNNCQLISKILKYWEEREEVVTTIECSSQHLIRF